MYSPNIALCFAFLLVASFSESQEDFTNGDEQSDNSTVQSDSLVNSTKYRNEEMELIRCNSHENSIKNKNQTQYESYINSTKNNCKNDSMRYESREHIIKNHEDNNQTPMEFYTNSTEINNFTLQEINENISKTEDKISSTVRIPYEYGDSNRKVKTMFVKNEECNDNVTCIQLCCPYGQNLTIKGRCIKDDHGKDRYSLPSMYTLPNKQKNNSEDEVPSEVPDELFLTVHDPCYTEGYGRQFVYANTYLFLTNGSLYMATGEFILPKSYCFAIMFRNVYDVIVCNGQTKLPVYISVCHLLSLPFLLLTFIIYSILPELRNMHGFTLRAHVGSLFITYSIIYFGQQTTDLAEKNYCVALAYIFNFFFLASFFWLNVTCFDIWWTFRNCIYGLLISLFSFTKCFLRNNSNLIVTKTDKDIYSVVNKDPTKKMINKLKELLTKWKKNRATFRNLHINRFIIVMVELRSHRREGKHYERKKLIIYSSYAWGVTIFLNVFCAIMDNISDPPENLIRPEICQKKFWYGENEAKTLYFYVPMGLTIISNVFFFVCTTLTILNQKMNTASELSNSEGTRHDENKQRFNMYLKLFIVMGITWVLEILSWVIGTNIVPAFIWYITDTINALQGLIIFIVFVFRKKIKDMILKLFRGKTCGPFKIPIGDSIASNSTTSTTLSRSMSMQQISSSN
ncbi:G-protein coupled receptor Mth2 [Trachymyrmex cornetzi]|uniref:G-protein coupled receptor Mth2 n=1 Tax=Trachymyrmex cornetzi TaxID=471704 RepID=A0A195DVI5_9HYME|nr:G-protein coupled receptor Mth2 [Trachymyrmex cornetzi]